MKISILSIIYGAALLAGCATSSMTSYYPSGQVQATHQSFTFIGTLNGLFSLFDIVLWVPSDTQYCAPCGKIIHRGY